MRTTLNKIHSFERCQFLGNL